MRSRGSRALRAIRNESRTRRLRSARFALAWSRATRRADRRRIADSAAAAAALRAAALVSRPRSKSSPARSSLQRRFDQIDRAARGARAARLHRRAATNSFRSNSTVDPAVLIPRPGNRDRGRGGARSFCAGVRPRRCSTSAPDRARSRSRSPPTRPRARIVATGYIWSKRSKWPGETRCASCMDRIEFRLGDCWAALRSARAAQSALRPGGLESALYRGAEIATAGARNPRGLSRAWLWRAASTAWIFIAGSRDGLRAILCPAAR